MGRMDKHKGKLLYILGLVMCINQGFNVIVGTLNDGTLRGVDMLMPVDIPMILLLFTQRDGTLGSRHRGFIMTIKVLLFMFWIWTWSGEFVAFEVAEFREQMFQLSRAMLIGYTVMTRVSTFSDLKMFVLGLLSSLGFEAFVGFWQWQIGPLNIPYLAASKGYRVSGTLGVPNTYGVWLVTLLPLALRMALYYRLKPQIIWLGVTLVAIMCLLATYTRGAWFSFLASTVLFTIIDVIRKKISMKQVSIFIAMAAVLGVIIAVKYGDTIKNRMSDTEESLAGKQKSSRLYLAQDAVRIIKEHSITGVALDNYRYYSDPEIEGTRIVHNVYLLISAEQGIPASVMFVLLMLVTFFGGFRLLKTRISFFYHAGAATMAAVMNLFIYYMIGLDYNLFEVLFQHWRVIGMIPAILICEEHTRKQLAVKALRNRARRLSAQNRTPVPSPGRRLNGRTGSSPNLPYAK
jgi:putative inorganic carbon (hco3(-)) transporter